ncbi:hypothetical protein Pmani_033307 [Petrolisthes manimaculis]|uniref:Uncharacterized protein n=1 Tax=Petrolisthes manimaculis TaxID=1843537 RepID=A0AAE1NRQ6_9EUCA|nr:hypothetical protein Pmani_033307 [Petrolisthes manimaculis]
MQGQEQKSGKERAKEIMVKMKLGDESGVERQLRIKSSRRAWPKKRGEEGKRVEWTTPRGSGGVERARVDRRVMRAATGLPKPTNQPTSPRLFAPQTQMLSHSQ